jgi:hypothetical protein
LPGNQTATVDSSGKTKERINMKKYLTVLLTISVLALALPISQAATEGDKTIIGVGACAKCVLKESKQCQATITTEVAGKKVAYYVTPNNVAKEFGDKLCAEKKKVTATGKVTTANGKQMLLASKIELAKD